MSRTGRVSVTAIDGSARIALASRGAVRCLRCLALRRDRHQQPAAATAAGMAAVPEGAARQLGADGAHRARPGPRTRAARRGACGTLREAGTSTGDAWRQATRTVEGYSIGTTGCAVSPTRERDPQDTGTAPLGDEVGHLELGRACACRRRRAGRGAGRRRRARSRRACEHVEPKPVIPRRCQSTTVGAAVSNDNGPRLDEGTMIASSSGHRPRWQDQRESGPARVLPRRLGALPPWRQSVVRNSDDATDQRRGSGVQRKTGRHPSRSESPRSSRRNSAIAAAPG